MDGLSDNPLDWLMLGIAIFIVGVQVGAMLEARLWRGKARGPMRKESGGKLYRVIEEE